MSEYQFVAFRAVDAPVSGDDLEFMREQSSRAEITPHEFTNEYHYGDFHGDAEEMLRRGYDVHLHYANFGIRKIMIRLPGGLPDPEAASHYLDGESLAFTPDDAGPGGILRVDPYFESGVLEDYWDHWELIDHLKTLRQEILDGDLRPLYIAALAVGIDHNHDPEESLEPPLPAGMNELTGAQRALAEFYAIDEAILSVVSAESLPRPKRTDRQQACADWIRRQPVEQKDAWLCQLIDSTEQSLRQSILKQYRQTNPPAVGRRRTSNGHSSRFFRRPTTCGMAASPPRSRSTDRSHRNLLHSSRRLSKRSGSDDSPQLPPTPRHSSDRPRS